MNLRDKIQALYSSTTSNEVKAICESFLQSGDSVKIAEKSLLESLTIVRSSDSNVDALLTEQEQLQNNISVIETKISKNAAQKMMENWGGTESRKISNVGNHVNKVMIREKEQEVKKEKALMEGLKTISDVDKSASQMLTSLESGSYGVSESIDTLKGSSIAKHPQFKYILEKFDGYINGNISESKIVRDYVSSLAAFTWDKEVNESYNKVRVALDGKAAELEVQNAIFDIKNTDHSGFFSSVVEKLNTWIGNDKRNVPSLIKEMKAYQFNSIVKNLTNNLLLMENAKGTQFNVPVNGSNCTVDSVYSPVVTKSGMQIFKAGDNFYASSKDGVNKMTESQVNALPKEYLELCEAFFNPSVKVVNENITVYVGKAKVTIGDTIRVNEQIVSADNLGSTLMTYSQGTIFGSISPLVNVAVKLAENADSIMDIDFGKAIFSNLYEGVGVYMFRRSDKIFINKVNPSMNENRFFEANGLQAVKFVKNFLSYNVSESLSDILSGDAKKKADMENSLGVVMGNINLLESELSKIENAILDNPEIEDVPEIVEAKDLVSNELNNAKSAWQTINSEIKKFENADEDQIGEPVEIIDEPKEEEDSATVVSVDPEAAITEPVGDVSHVEIASTSTTDDVVSNGVAGAEGAQVQTQEIQGNDHADANAPTEANSDTQMVDAGFAGADGTQAVDNTNMADASDVAATSIEVDLTIPDNLTPNAQDAADNVAKTEEIPAIDTEVHADGVIVDAGNEEGGDAVVGTDEAPADEIIVDNQEGEEKSNEALDTNVQVKLKGGDKMGKITASNSTEHSFTVLWDDGESSEHSESDLEEIKPESDSNQADNVASAIDAAEKMEEDAEQAPEGSPVEEPEVADMYVKATITIDFGPYKEGEQVDISASDYTASGEDDPIKIKDPKNEIATLPKKYVKVLDDAPQQEMTDLESKIENIVKSLEEIGTIVNGNDKIDNKSIEDALGIIKAYQDAISKENK